MRSVIVRGRTDRTQIRCRSNDAIIPVILNMQRLGCIGRMMKGSGGLNLNLHFYPVKKSCNQDKIEFCFPVYCMKFYQNGYGYPRIAKRQCMAPCEPKDSFDCVPQCFQRLHDSLLLLLYSTTNHLHQTLKE